MVPLLIKVQQLQHHLIDQPDAFGTAWNWVDAFVRIEYRDSLQSTASFARLCCRAVYCCCWMGWTRVGPSGARSSGM